jgi:hypothetical protein
MTPVLLELVKSLKVGEFLKTQRVTASQFNNNEKVELNPADMNESGTQVGKIGREIYDEPVIPVIYDEPVIPVIYDEPVKYTVNSSFILDFFSHPATKTLSAIMFTAGLGLILSSILPALALPVLVPGIVCLGLGAAGLIGSYRASFFTSSHQQSESIPPVLAPQM